MSNYNIKKNDKNEIMKKCIKDVQKNKKNFSHTEKMDFSADKKFSFERLSKEEEKAINNLVAMSRLSSGFKRSNIPSVEFIRNTLKCKSCMSSYSPTTIQMLIYCGYYGDFRMMFDQQFVNNLNCINYKNNSVIKSVDETKKDSLSSENKLKNNYVDNSNNQKIISKTSNKHLNSSQSISSSDRYQLSTQQQLFELRKNSLKNKNLVDFEKNKEECKDNLSVKNFENKENGTGDFTNSTLSDFITLKDISNPEDTPSIKSEGISLLENNIKIVHDKEKGVSQFYCKFCDSNFTSKNGLNYHIKYVHTVEKSKVIKPFTCPFKKCNKKYKNKNGLYYHLTHRHHDEVDDVNALFAMCMVNKKK